DWPRRGVTRRAKSQLFVHNRAEGGRIQFAGAGSVGKRNITAVRRGERRTTFTALCPTSSTKKDRWSRKSAMPQSEAYSDQPDQTERANILEIYRAVLCDLTRLNANGPSTASPATSDDSDWTTLTLEEFLKQEQVGSL